MQDGLWCNCPCGHEAVFSGAGEWGLPAGGSLGLNVTVGTRWLTRPAGEQGLQAGAGGAQCPPLMTPAGRTCLARPLVQTLAAREPCGDALPRRSLQEIILSV